MTMLAKAVAVLFVLIIGLDLYGRWTGKSFTFNLLGSNPIGALLNNS